MPDDRSLYTRVKDKLEYAYESWQCRNLQREPAWQQVNGNFYMKLGSEDLMDRAFYLGDYDPVLLQVIAQQVRLGDHCIDIGAHKGYVALSLASSVGPEGKVFAFEPDGDVGSRLLENVEYNRSSIQVFPYALGPEEGEATFFLSQQTGWSSRFPNEMAQAKIKSEVVVPIKVVDELVRTGEMAVDPARLSFVKIDCEGSEPGVLAGMKELLVQSSPLLWIEVNRDSLRVAGSSIAALESILLELGLRLYTCEQHKPLWGQPQLQFKAIDHIPTDQEFAFDIVATRRTFV